MLSSRCIYISGLVCVRRELLKKTICSSPLLCFYSHSKVVSKCTNWISLAWMWWQDVLQDCPKCTPAVNGPSVQRSTLEPGWWKSHWQHVCECWSLPPVLSLQIPTLGPLTNVDMFFSWAGGGNKWTNRLFPYSLLHVCSVIWQSGSCSWQSGSYSPVSFSSFGPLAALCTELARMIAQIYNSIRWIDKAAVTRSDWGIVEGEQLKLKSWMMAWDLTHCWKGVNCISLRKRLKGSSNLIPDFCDLAWEQINAQR